ncbi:IclR family transcriptional regulator [Gandjariella thermophila]|uniref:Transcriptional regulator n=1 Tax=Gandjariella thermophila TaxID=1931992 RepID=A0A4D4J869_9PSEU|nr:IclR family transcriptional regulator [Gandjariella thermophila]GDY32851.1 transcriptional regulator [Gandjariella thermophila]
MPKDHGASGSDSVRNALRILLLLRERESARVTDVSAHLGVAPSTAHRLLSTLRTEGFVDQEAGSRRYRLGLTLLSMAREALTDRTLPRAARPHLERLCTEVNETVNLLVLDGAEALFVDGVEGRHPLRVAPRTGDRIPAFTAAGGKVLLAELPEGRLRGHYPHGLPSVTPATITDFDALLAELRCVRARGYAVNLGESVVDVHAVGVLVRDGHGGPLAGLTISAPASRLPRGRARELAPLLRRTAAAITADLPS